MATAIASPKSKSTMSTANIEPASDSPPSFPVALVEHDWGAIQAVHRLVPHLQAVADEAARKPRELTARLVATVARTHEARRELEVAERALTAVRADEFAPEDAIGRAERRIADAKTWIADQERDESGARADVADAERDVVRWRELIAAAMHGRVLTRRTARADDVFQSRFRSEFLGACSRGLSVDL